MAEKKPQNIMPPQSATDEKDGAHNDDAASSATTPTSLSPTVDAKPEALTATEPPTPITPTAPTPAATKPPPADEWAPDTDNPANWSKGLKIFHTFIPAYVAFICTLASSIYTPGRDSVIADFGVSEEVSNLPYVLYVLGLGFGPLVASPISETLGRRAVYMVSVPVFALFILGSGFSQGIASLTICRFFAGFFGSPGLGIGTATLSEIWMPAERAVPTAFYVMTPFLGPAIGPLVGGYAAAAYGWRWTEWILLFFTAAIIPPLLFMKETYKSAILKRRAKKLGLPGPSGPQRTVFQAAVFFLRSTLTRPLHMAATEPVVFLLTLYVGLNFGILYGFFAALPNVWATKYGFGIGAIGLTFLPLGIGAVIGASILIIFARTVFKKAVVESIKAGRKGKVAPEIRLYPSMIGGPCLVISLFWFAWSAQAGVHWICPVIAETFYGLGNFLVFMSASLYVMDFYGPLYGASAMAGQTLIRYVVGAVFPLFVEQMFGRLGVGWAVSIFGFLSLILACVPYAFYVSGPKLRQHSKYAPKS